ncbi:urea ABC transporter permease subunit UrtB [Leucothrix mucor]|uniref:urea ABC transporter permease subunit UrtB n=1 Tax=Leucothrix mucor TaxID=45248 RepID=UPI0003B3DA76|nr:urea ABC transporter permease subunit UrtB [Leucothrix mucor]
MQQNRYAIRYWVFALLLSLFSGLLTTANADESVLQAGIENLLAKGFNQKIQGAKQVAESGDERAEQILKALLDRQLFSVKSDDTLVFFDEDTDPTQAKQVISGEMLPISDDVKLSRIRTNNKMRGQINQLLAQIQLSSPSAEKRLAAVKAITGKADAEQVELVSGLLKTEPDVLVQKEMQTLISLSELSSDEPERVLAAIGHLKGNLNQLVRPRLESLAESDNKQIADAATQTLVSINEKVKWYGHLETLFFGLSLGSVLVLAAIGLAITFGVMGVINMAHGELIMIGAYTTYSIQHYILPNYPGIALVLSIPAAFIVAGLVGIVIEKTVIRHLYGRPLETLLATFGISLILQQAVRSIFSPLNRSVEAPSWMSGSIQVNEVLSLTLNRMYVIAFCLVVFTALFLVLKKTSLGLQVRAVSQNRGMARAMGVKASKVDAMTFGLGAGIAGIAGVALSQLTNVGPNLGQGYIIDSFMVVVFGGVGNLWGTLISGFTLGVANKFMEPWAGAVLAKILVLVFIILFIQKRPRGLFPQKGRAAEN